MCWYICPLIYEKSSHRVNTCRHVRSWILRPPVCVTHFFQAKECVCVCVWVWFNQTWSPRHPLSLSLCEHSSTHLLFNLLTSRKRKLSAQLCRSQTLIRTSLDYPTSNKKLWHEHRNMWQMATVSMWKYTHGTVVCLQCCFFLGISFLLFCHTTTH